MKTLTAAIKTEFRLVTWKRFFYHQCFIKALNGWFPEHKGKDFSQIYAEIGNTPKTRFLIETLNCKEDYSERLVQLMEKIIGIEKLKTLDFSDSGNGPKYIKKQIHKIIKKVEPKNRKQRKQGNIIWKKDVRLISEIVHMDASLFNKAMEKITFL